MIKKSFALRVLALCFLLLALPLLINTFVFFKDTNTASIKEVKGSLKEETIVRTFSFQEAVMVDDYLINAFIYILEKNGNEKDFSEKKLNQLFMDFHDLTPNYNFLLIQDTNTDASEGKIIGSNIPSKIGRDFPVSYCVKKLQEGKPLGFIRRIYDEKEKVWETHILTGRTVTLQNLSNSSNTQYIFVIYNDISNFANEILEPAKGIDAKYFAIVQNEGYVLAASDSALLGNVFLNLTKDKNEWKHQKPGRLGEIPLKKPLKISQAQDPPYFEFFFNDRTQLAYSKPLPLCSATLVAYSGKHTFFAKEITNFLFIYFFYGVILIVGGGITFWITLWLSRPLQQLAMVMNNVANNNLKVRYKKAPMGYEINFLGEAFNNTLDFLLENMKKLEDIKVEKEAFRKEVSIGKEVQKRMIPLSTLIIDEVEIEGRYKSGLTIGGDFHDYSVIRKEDNTMISLVVADASGKGISSCLYALSLRSLLRSNLTLSQDIGEIIRATNNSFLDLAGDTGMFVTLLMGMYHTKTGILYYYSCGNPPGFILRGDEVIELEHRGMAMGLVEVDNLEISSIQLQKGDFVVFFTDGLISILNPEGIIFSKKRVISTLKRQRWSSAKELVTEVLNVIDDFTLKIDSDVELTLLVMKIK